MQKKLPLERPKKKKVTVPESPNKSLQIFAHAFEEPLLWKVQTLATRSVATKLVHVVLILF